MLMLLLMPVVLGGAEAASAPRAAAPDELLGIPSLFLRLHDPALITANGQRLFEIADVLTDDQSYFVQETWAASASSVGVRWGDGHTSEYPSRLLRRWSGIVSVAFWRRFRPASVPLGAIWGFLKKINDASFSLG